MEPVATAAIIAAGGTAIGGILGIVLKYLYDQRKLRVEQDSGEDHRVDTVTSTVIADLRMELKETKKEMASIRSEHLNCERTAARMQAEIDQLRGEVDQLRRALSDHEKH